LGLDVPLSDLGNGKHGLQRAVAHHRCHHWW
jgi:hypothetical protein